MTLELLVEEGLFPNRKKASYKMIQWRKKNHVRFIGYLRTKEGRPEDVYCNGWRPREDRLEHEVELTRALRSIQRSCQAQVVRGYNAVDQKYHPDAELVIGKKYFIELDRGTMDYREIKEKRYKRYADCKTLVLWIARSETRRDNLRRHAEVVQLNALFATYFDVLSNPLGDIWTDYFEQPCSMEIPGDNP